MKFTIKQHPLKDGFTHSIHVAGGNGKLIAEVRGERYAKELVEAKNEILRALENLSAIVTMTDLAFTASNVEAKHLLAKYGIEV